MRGNAGNIAKVLIMGAMLMLERSALALHQTPGVIEPGDTVSFSVVFNNSQNNQTALEDVRFVLLSAPPWLTSLPTSMIDPVVVPAGESVEFRLDFEVNNAFSLDEAKGEVIAEIKTSSANLNASRLVWQWRTSNGFKTSSAELRDEQGNTFNGSLSPDKEPPDTALSFIGPTFMDSQGALFISSSTALNLEGIDAIVVDAVTSEVAFTGFKLDQQVSDVNLLDAFVGTFTVSSPGNHFIVFGSSDNAGNAESVKISSFIVDAQAPGTPSNLLADGSNPSPWRNISTFTVTLSGSDDASGVAGAFFKVGAVPGFGSDGMFVAGSSSQNFIFQNLIFENLVNGSNPLYVWLQDNVGNTDHATAQIVNLRFDDLKPQSTAAVSASTFSVGPIPVSFTSFDQNGTVGSGMDRTFLWFRRDNNDDGILGDWQQTGLEILGTTGNFIFEIPGLQDGNYEFYTQAKDIAGNFEDAPLGTTPAKAGAFFDASSPIIFNIQVPLIASNFAQIVWTTDDRTTALVEYSTNSAFPAGLTKTKTVGVSTRTHGVFIDCSVLSPAVIYFRITAINKTGLITTSQTGNFTTPANVFIPQDIFGVVDVAKPIAISVTNPGVTMATVTINGQTVFLVLSTSSAAQVFVDTGTVAQGEENVNISLDGFGFNQGVLIDTAQRSARLARLSSNSGGGFSEAIGQSQMEIAIGEIGPGPDSSISTTGYLASGGNRLYTGYFAGIDPVSPSAITDLLAQPQGEGSVRLAWSAPGDDAAVGTVMNYDIRFASFALSAENFTQGVKAANPPSPIAAPGNQEFEISNLSDGATYFFAIKAFDELFNESLSNIGRASPNLPWLLKFPALRSTTFPL
ncbi:MAG: hypothetical protein HYT79_08950 [Elusimicrobia bacterium]|nr:hypothetical protein [Elusimicrobiota bacterium]